MKYLSQANKKEYMMCDQCGEEGFAPQIQFFTDRNEMLCVGCIESMRMEKNTEL